VAIVETWSTLHKRGMIDNEIFSRIEHHRSKLYPPGHMPTHPDLLNYIKYRIEIEHSEGAPISQQFLVQAIDTARKAYGA